MPRMRGSIIVRYVGVGFLVHGAITSASVSGQPAQRPPATNHITIPFLASASQPAELSFEGGECDIDPARSTMTCEFQQVFLTTSDIAPGTCLITTNRYARVFTRQGNARWISNGTPEGPCGTSESTTLQDDGSVRWTMETRKRVARKDADPACRDIDERPETLSWHDLRRPLPCAFIQPGGLSR